MTRLSQNPGSRPRGAAPPNKTAHKAPPFDAAFAARAARYLLLLIWTLAASGSLRVIGLDDFKRDFSIDLGTTVARPTALSVEDVFGSLDRRIEVADSILADGSSVSIAYDRKLPASGDAPFYQEHSRSAGLAGFSLVSKHSNGGETALGAGGFASSYFGIGGLQMEGVSLGLVPALSNPYFSLVPGASHAALAQQFGGGLKIKFGVLTSALNQTFASQDGLYPRKRPSGCAAEGEFGLDRDIEVVPGCGRVAVVFADR